MPKRAKFDNDLLIKQLRQGEMTVRELADMWEVSAGYIRRYREHYDIEKKLLFRCNICGEMKAANCYRFTTDVCIICRKELGWVKPYQKGHKKKAKVYKLRTALCHNPECRATYRPRYDRINGEKLDNYCPICEAVRVLNSVEHEDVEEHFIRYG